MVVARSLAVLGICLAAGVANAGPVFRTIALSGAQAPGLPAGVTFGFLSDPRINNTGQVLYYADLAGTGITSDNDGSLWTDRAGPLALAYREGDATGQGATVWAALPGPALSGSGRVAFTGALRDAANQPINLGVFAEDAAFALQKVAREGEAPPPPSAGTWARLPQAQLSDSGQSAFNGSLTSGQGIWTAPPVSPVALSGAPAAGLLFDYLDVPTQNAGGSLLFRASLKDTALPPHLDSSLWTAGPGGLTLMADTRSPAPGTEGTFAEFAIRPPLTAQGSTVFWARIGATVFDDEGIWTGSASGLSLVVREGLQAAGCPGGVPYGSLGRHPAISPSGVIAFTAHLTGLGVDATNNSGLWLVPAGGTPTLLVREGGQVPRMPAGTVFAGFGEPFMNDAGQLAFAARLRGPGIDPTNDQALFITDRAGLLYPILRTGRLFDVGSGSPRLVNEVIFDSDLPQTGRTQFADTAAGGTVICKLVFYSSSAPPASAYSSAIVTASLRCLTDFDNNGSLGVNDFVGFLNAFAAQDLLACDFAGDGALNVNDFVGFLNAVAVGCQ